ncbi:hypothetical protein [Waterburya agarophytonicola]|nr:hypothetical protein [Waterburya agarophytonicola]
MTNKPNTASNGEHMVFYGDKADKLRAKSFIFDENRRSQFN